jgi:hypothetical protein
VETAIAQYGTTTIQTANILQPPGGFSHQKIDETMALKNLADYFMCLGGNALTRFKIKPEDVPIDLLECPLISIELCYIGTQMPLVPGANLRACIGAGYSDVRFLLLISMDTFNIVVDGQIDIPFSPPLTRAELLQLEIEWDWIVNAIGGDPPKPYDPPT